MQADAQTLFIPGRSPLHRLHPFTKLCYLLVTGVSVYLLPGGWTTGVALLLLNTGIALGCGLFTPAWKVIWRIILPLALFMVPIHGTLYPGNLTPVTCIREICLFEEGLVFALGMILKLTVILVASLFFVFTTHPADLITALTRSAGSPALAYLVGSPLLLLPSVRRRIATIQSAQQARGMDTQGNVFNRFKALPPLVIPLVLGALVEIEQRSIALELKGFRSKQPKTSLRRIPDSLAQRRARQIMLAASAGIILFKIAGAIYG